MAEISTRSVLCRYFLSNTCRDGNQCRFSHDRTTGIVDNVCRFYQKGECRYGARCRYDHVRKHLNGNKELISRGKNFKQPDSNPNESLGASSGNCPGPSGFSTSVVSEDRSFAQLVRGPIDDATAERERLARLNICDHYMISGICRDKHCKSIHGDYCETCTKYILHPFNKEKREQHQKECTIFHQKLMLQEKEFNAAVAKSAKLSCGVCMETVLDKEPISMRRFGILENCPHIFCLTCIRKWRKVRNVDVKSARGCPECRTSSDFVTPSPYFVDSGEQKKRLINGYKQALAAKPCKYFKQGRGICPFSTRCFYKHSFPDGSLASDDRRGRVYRIAGNGGNHHFEDLMFMELINNLIPADEDFINDVYDDIFHDFSDPDTDGDMYSDDDYDYDGVW